MRQRYQLLALTVAALIAVASAWPLETLASLYVGMVWLHCENYNALSIGCNSDQSVRFYMSVAFVLENIALAGYFIWRWWNKPRKKAHG